MLGSNRRLVHRAIALLAALALIAGHGAVLYFVAAHTTLSVIVVGAVVAVAVHLGALRALTTRFRSRPRPCT
jgi:hypothetical protein